MKLLLTLLLALGLNAKAQVFYQHMTLEVDNTSVIWFYVGSPSSAFDGTDGCNFSIVTGSVTTSHYLSVLDKTTWRLTLPGISQAFVDSPKCGINPEATTFTYLSPTRVRVDFVFRVSAPIPHTGVIKLRRRSGINDEFAVSF